MTSYGDEAFPALSDEQWARLQAYGSAQEVESGALLFGVGEAARLDTTHERLTSLKHEGGTLDTYLANYGLFHLEADQRWIDMTAARLDALAREVRK